MLNKPGDVLKRDRKIDDILTSKRFGIPIMILLLAIIIYITVQGANYPSQLLANFLFEIEDQLILFSTNMNIPYWIYGPLVLGMYRTLAWVVSVMLPPNGNIFPLIYFLRRFRLLATYCRITLTIHFKEGLCPW